MPKRTDIKTILIIGAGPIVIGQACEFDYSGAQACKALREEGYKVVLVNSNPATIMTDPDMADVTYIEPIEWRTVEKIIEKERPDAILPTMGGQTALNCALDLSKNGVLKKYNVELIGAKEDAIDKAEDRGRFKEAMEKIGLSTPKSFVCHTLEEAWAAQAEVGFPTLIRPSFTMGGSGGGIAYNKDEFYAICERGFDASPTHELLIEQSVLGWKEYEMEVVRDKADNCIIVCSIENFDPMGVHTGDSITVAPAQTLTDKEYQIMRNASIAVLREIGVDTGGSNVQFAINPENGEMIVIEMNPRVSRSSALASKATGFPIAKVAAKLAVGYTLNELRNDITGGLIPASFEPSIDYVVTKVPRFAFEKFPQADDRLTTQMKSVGEVMAMGRTFQESLQKALRGLETGICGFNLMSEEPEKIRQELGNPGPIRILYVADAFGAGFTLDEVHHYSKIDPWFLIQIQDLVLEELALEKRTLDDLDYAELRRLKRKGFSDKRIAQLTKSAESAVRNKRVSLNLHPVYKRVDTCAGEFTSDTAYLYSTYEEECESRPSDKKKIMILGGGPNRIGQGIEFDYCCVHASLALREAGFETIMVNCNPETVSTDFDTSDRLYFEPLTLEDVLEIIHVEKPHGVIVHYGGQTPLKLANDLHANGVNIIGTSADSIDAAEDRERFQQILHKLHLKQPTNRTARNAEEAVKLAEEVGYPLVVRPSYVLGGRAMQIVYNVDELQRYMREAVSVSNDSPILLDHFLNNAIEVDVDCICDGAEVVIGGIMQHIEQAGIHSGDSACSLPPYSLSQEVQDEIRRQTAEMAFALGVKGLMNVQFAVQDGVIYVLEVNPRASRTVPFVSKATGRPLAKIAARVMAGESLKAQGIQGEVIPPFYSVKEAVFPFIKFPGVDTVLGPEMRSTGEVMGVGATFAEAFLKAQLGANERIPKTGKVFLSVNDADKPRLLPIARQLQESGYGLCATLGTAKFLREHGVAVQIINKVREGRPNIVDAIKNGEIAMVINTVSGLAETVTDGHAIRRSALQQKVFLQTTLAGAEALAGSVEYLADSEVYSLQDLHQRLL
ncbi:carbamoyl-phosphate synthase large subunit [Pasteurella multocida subsp. multocida]|uniref:Carbamoyl phosphate synthase large chain n=1 Tax=Pasteurella multocida TaxID=747 RepID=A0A849CL90_PASMD|nr:carbamoyl-phosphate synthase large subunit [Pasteurella multocida]AFF24999.1 carbamoyl phosphate synthase large subunit [Pasteurella multocida subsp. multocida str. HN06]AFI46937.1 carbamoyl-phosphate synthase, large subunit [Pasteurella multocida subsp. multocida str. 3480]AWW53306.1 carbamoyl-phosphate synthase large subunit [Pasteurella multocida]EPE71092.1 carbamoyl phosphate synthase large subunit [Pasteurella multocida 671/90]MCL7774591.1 carbamoyl-phosphate synthase large subunit [Pa